MKKHFALFSTAFALFGGLLTAHAEKNIEAGPKGGRILEKTSPKAEFLVEKDHTVTVSFYDQSLKPVAVVEQAVTVIAEAKDGKKKLEFEKKGDALVSKEKLPEGDGYNVVVQFKATANSKPQNYRFKFDQHVCGKCHRAEYACICDE